jgi:hypothetical protein
VGLIALKAGAANQLDVFLGCFLRLVGVPEEQSHARGLDKFAAGLGEQQYSSGSQHPHKLPQRVLLANHVVQQLMAQHHIHGAVGQFEMRRVSPTQDHAAAAMAYLFVGALDLMGVYVEADDLLR